MNSKTWLIGFFSLIAACMIAIGGLVFIIDPFFHYHKPVPELYYRLDMERYQNDGIVRNFDYDAVVVGSSMVNTIKTTQVNWLYDCLAIKIPFAAGSFYETNSHLTKALDTHDVDTVVRSLEFQMIIQEPDMLRYDLGDIEYPFYLYNDNPFDDVEYLFNKDVLFGKVTSMLDRYKLGEVGGVTSFNRYANYMYYSNVEFSKESCLNGRTSFGEPETEIHLSEEDRKKIEKNVSQNLIAVARNNPDTTFYYFIPPWSVVHWGEEYEAGKLARTLEAEKVMVRMLLWCDNIRLYSFNMWTDVTEDLDLYKDQVHCTSEVYDRILRSMRDDDPQFRITKGNYEEFLDREMEYYMNFDYNSIFNDSANESEDPAEVTGTEKAQASGVAAGAGEPQAQGVTEVPGAAQVPGNAEKSGEANGIYLANGAEFVSLAN